MKRKRTATIWFRNLVRTATLATVLAHGIAWAQGTSPTVKDDLFAGTERFAKGASDVTEVTMDPDTLDMVSGKDASRAHSMVLNVVRTYEYDRPGMYHIADVEEIRQRLNTGDWHCSVHKSDTKRGESTDICYKRRADAMLERAIITVEPKELTFIHTIRRRNGEGSSLGGIDFDGFGSLSGLPPAAMMAMAGPTINVNMMALEAEMRAHQAEMEAHGLEQMQGLGGADFFHGPVQLWHFDGTDQLAEQLKHLPATSPEQMKQLQDQLKQLQNPAPPDANPHGSPDKTPNKPDRP